MATRINLIIDQGSSFSQTIELLSNTGDLLSVTDLIATSQMRKSYQANASITIDTALSTGQLILSMNAASTSLITPGRYVYDVKLSSNTSIEVDRLIEGVVTVTPGVS